MNTHIQILKTTRTNYLKAIENLSIDQLTTIPKGFNNNIIWNVGHTIVTQQLLQYKLSGTPMVISDDLVEKYRKGSVPSKNLSQEELSEIKELLKSTPEQLEKDLAKNSFGTFKLYPTSYGFELKTLEDAIIFNNVHEGLHLGYVMALKRAI